MNEYVPYLLLIIIGFVTGAINTISGGGSALSLPALILLGLPPVVANGTNRVSVLIQSIASLLGFKSKGVSYAPFPNPGNIGVWIAVLLGAIIGAAIAIDIKGPLFNKILAVVIFTIASMVVFAYYGHINYSYGLLMGFGSAGGGWVASRWSVNRGDGLVKIFLVFTVVLIAIKLWWDN